MFDPQYRDDGLASAGSWVWVFVSTASLRSSYNPPDERAPADSRCGYEYTGNT